MVKLSKKRKDEIKQYFKETLCGSVELCNRFKISPDEAVELIKEVEAEGVDEVAGVGAGEAAALPDLIALTKVRLAELLREGMVEELVSGYAGTQAKVMVRKLDAKDMKLIAETLAKLQEVDKERGGEGVKQVLRVEFVEKRCDVEG